MTTGKEAHADGTRGRRPSVAGLSAALASIMLLLAPAALFLADLPRFGRLQYFDYYGIIAQVVEGDALSSNPLTWLEVKSNEHTILLPLLVYALNIKLTGGSNLGLSAFSLALQGGVLLLLLGMLPRPMRDPPLLRTTVALFLSVMTFAPVLAHNIIMGFSGSMWFLANLLAVGAMAALVRSRSTRSPLGLIFVLALAWGSCASFSTGLAVFPALLLGALALRASRATMALLLGGATLPVLFELLTYSRPTHHPGLVLFDPPRLAAFASAYLGSVVGEPLWVAGLAGGLAVVCALLAGFVTLFRADEATRTALAPWLMVQAYGLVNAIATAVGRSGWGGARSPRYGSLSALFWCGLVVVLLTLLAEKVRLGAMSRPTFVRVALASVTILIAGAYWRGLPVLSDYLRQAAAQPLAELAIVEAIPDDQAIAPVTPAPAQVFAVRDFLKATRHVPFDRSPGPLLGRLLPEPPVTCPGCRPATITTGLVTPVDPGFMRVHGTIDHVDSSTLRLATLAPDGVVQGIAILLPAESGGDGGTRWVGYLHASADTSASKLLLVDEDRACTCPVSSLP